MGFDCITSPSFLPVSSWFLLYVINCRKSLQSFFLSMAVLQIVVILVCS